jgi:hypothetical protein
MLKTILVKQLIGDGERLVAALESRRLPMDAAFWYHIPDLLRWRLFIATPLVESSGPRAAYVIIQETLTALQPHSLSLSDVSVLSPQESAFQRIRLEMERSGLWTTSRDQGDVVFEDAYVYRL